MKVMINALSVHTGGGLTSFLSLLPAIERTDNVHEYVVLISERQQHLEQVITSRYQRHLVHFDARNVFKRILYEQFVLPFVILRKGIDWLYSVGNVTSVLAPCRILLVVENANPYSSLDFDWSFTERLKMGILNILGSVSALRATKIRFLSQNSRRIIGRHLQIPERRSFILPHGGVTEVAPGRHESKLELPDRYILTVTNIAPHKNLHTLITAFEMLVKNEEYAGSLVIAGAAPYGQYYQRLLALRSRSVHPERIVFLGWVDPAQTKSLYSRADLFAFPSVEETFGLPVLEAMAHGVPVIVPSADKEGKLFVPYWELCGEAATYFDAFDDRDLSNKMLLVVRYSIKKEQGRGWKTGCRALPLERCSYEVIESIYGSGMSAKVYVGALREKEDGLKKLFAESADYIGLAERARTARRIFIKPNLTFPVYKKGVTTRVEFVRGLVECLLTINPKLHVIIGEGEGGYNSFSMTSAMEKMGFTRIAQEYEQVEIVNLSRLPAQRLTLDTQKGPYAIDLPLNFFESIDFSISCPLPKVHAMTKITLSFKNIWGCLPDVMRLKNHYMFPHIISTASRVLKFDFAFLDGKYGLTTNGPMDGDAIEVDWFVAANSLGAFDATVSRMMGFAWNKIPHLKIAASYGLVPDLSGIDIMGDPNALRRKFRLKRELWNYPALSAFHSKYLTHFFYLSRYADFMHDVMYTFRRRPIPLDHQTGDTDRTAD